MFAREAVTIFIALHARKPPPQVAGGKFRGIAIEAGVNATERPPSCIPSARVRILPECYIIWQESQTHTHVGDFFPDVPLYYRGFDGPCIFHETIFSVVPPAHYPTRIALTRTRTSESESERDNGESTWTWLENVTYRSRVHV